MNYYPHNIGDFNNATRHLTHVERALYRELIETYYDTEQPLPAGDLDRLCRRVLAVSDAEKEAVKSLLAEFFSLDGDVYRNGRCDEEILIYKGKQANAVKAGLASAQSRLNKRSTGVQQPLRSGSTKQEPRTKNQDKPKALAGFTEFYAAYPKKVARPKAEKSWNRIAPDGALLEKILTAVQAQRESELWTKDEGKFIPHPATWLNDQRWNDEVSMPAPQRKASW